MKEFLLVLQKPLQMMIISQGSDASNFIGSDQKVAPYQLAVF